MATEGTPIKKRPTGLPDWDVPRRPALTPPEVAWLAGIEVAVAVSLFVLGSRFGTGRTGLGLVVLAAAAVALSLFTSGRRALMRADARRIGPGEEPRFTHLAEGLARDLGVRVPGLRVVPEGGPNALVTAGGTIAVTRSMLETYSRTELEAVLAHCFVRLADPRLKIAHLASELMFLAGPMRPFVGYEDDIRAAAITRYPPALASAIGKAEPRTGRHEPLWFAASGRWHRSPEERTAALEDL